MLMNKFKKSFWVILCLLIILFTGCPGIGNVVRDYRLVTWNGLVSELPDSPQNFTLYYNTSDGLAYIYEEGEWIALSGMAGGMIWKGFMAAPPGAPGLNWVYYNITMKVAFIFDGENWVSLGETSPSPVIVLGPEGLSVSLALEQLPAEGGTLFLKAGIYHFTEGVHINRSNVTIIGEQGTVIKLGDRVNQPVFLFGSDEEIPSYQIRNLRVANLEIDGNRENQDFEYDPARLWIRNNGIDIRAVDMVRINNVNIFRARSGGVVASWGSSNIFIHGSGFYENYFDGIALYDSENIHVTDFQCSRNRAAGISLDNRLSGVIFQGGFIEGNGSVGIFARDSWDISFQNLIISENGEDGCFLSHNSENPGATGVTRLFFGQCSFLNNQRWGLWLASPKTVSPGNWLVSCLFSGNLSGEIKLDPLAELGGMENQYEPYIKQCVDYLEELQDLQPSGLVPVSMSESGFTTTYLNALAAMAFTLEGRLERARRIFDVFAVGPDPFPGAQGAGGYQQFRKASDGESDPSASPNDYWLGDNMYLLAALRNYKYMAKDHRYDNLISQLVDWTLSVKSLTPGDGIYAGFRSDGSLKEEKHGEGNIDAYGALKGLADEGVLHSIKTWIESNLWIPGAGGEFARGNDNIQNLPTDHAAWGYLALGPGYASLLEHAEALNKRSYNPYLIENFERDPGPYNNPGQQSYWQISQSGTPLEGLALVREAGNPGDTLAVHYTFNTANQWFLFYRTEDVDLRVSDNFKYSFMIDGDGSGLRFEVKLYNFSGEAYSYTFPLDFTGWKSIEVDYRQFSDFGGPHLNPLTRIGRIEFAMNNETQVNASGAISLSNIRYEDRSSASRKTVNLFSAFESEKNKIYVDSTLHMATAYSVAGQTASWQDLMDEITDLLVTSPSGRSLGLPFFLHGAVNQVEASMAPWYVIAARGLNPFNGN